MTNSAYAKNKGDGLLCSILWLRSRIDLNLLRLFCSLAKLGKLFHKDAAE